MVQVHPGLPNHYFIYAVYSFGEHHDTCVRFCVYDGRARTFHRNGVRRGGDSACWGSLANFVFGFSAVRFTSVWLGSFVLSCQRYDIIFRSSRD